MSPASLEPTLMEPMAKPRCGVTETRSLDEESRFAGLRSFQWRVNLGILPSSPSASIDDVRRVTADSRRRYASLRRRLLVDPHIQKDRSDSPDLCMDNPLSQNPDSTWSRFFRNAELEKMVDQDLSRLYPEHGNYFQNTGCLGMLRRILLLWCLRHPEYGYRQGMHELLAPLFYVLNVDIERLSEVRKLYEDHFTDKYDGVSFLESDNTYNFDFRKSPDPMEDENDSTGSSKKVRSLDELDPEIQIIILLSDAYGAEGELGVVLSEKFMEHDAYCMFDALMSGSNGAVAMADFFYSAPVGGSQPNSPPVIEASAAIYHLLSVVDSSIHSHLVELGVEPQYFALRWLRVLFGREFSLEDLLVIWDEIFASDNAKLNSQVEDDSDGYRILDSHRGAFISAMAVSMILHIRSSLLATENATVCLQRLLNFPDKTDVKKLIEKAKSLQVLALDSNISSSCSVKRNINHTKSMPARGHSLSFDFGSPSTPPGLVRESYWEEKWRDLHKAEELKQDDPANQIPHRRKSWTEKVKMKLYRAESAPAQGKAVKAGKDQKSSVRRKLLEDLSRVLGPGEDDEKLSSHEDVTQKENGKGSLSTEVRVKRQDSDHKNVSCTAEVGCSSAIDCSEENSSIFSDPASPLSGANEHDNDSEKSSIASNLSPDESNDHLQGSMGESTLPVSSPHEDLSVKHENNIESVKKSAAGLKEKNPLSSKFQWIRKLGWNASAEGTSVECASQAVKSLDNESYTSGPSTAFASRTSSFRSRGDPVEQNGGETLRSLGRSMLEHIQVIESVLEQESGQMASMGSHSRNDLVVKGQVTAAEALQELKKISNILSEM